MSRFGNLKEAAANVPEPVQLAGKATQENRHGRKVISGYFSPAMSVAMRTTALRRGITLQQAMAEAFNMWLRDNGESPIGE
jgi:hypothetical protein